MGCSAIIITNEGLIIDLKELLSIDIKSNFAIPKYLLLNDKVEFVKELYSPVTPIEISDTNL